LAEIADLVCGIWTEPDAGLWEVRSGTQHFTQSKMMCAIALECAIRLGRASQIPSRHASRWHKAATAIREFVDEHCWSMSKGSYVRHPGNDELDAAVLLGVLFGYGDLRDTRLRATVEAVRLELAHGPFVYRYSGEDGLSGNEGSFLTCSFWPVEALALQGWRAEAGDLMAQLVGLANDVGLFAEEVDPTTRDFLGNLPQGLTHLALIGPRSPWRRRCAVSIWGALAGGFAGTLVLTTVLRTASGARLTRMDLPFLFGTAVTSDRRRAKLIGYLAHFGFGMVFALIYYGC
jgi:GH15 family glucan-1,4-alpha-glucosidase